RPPPVHLGHVSTPDCRHVHFGQAPALDRRLSSGRSPRRPSSTCPFRTCHLSFSDMSALRSADMSRLAMSAASSAAAPRPPVRVVTLLRMLRRVASRVSMRSRRRKLRLFVTLVAPGPQTTIVDVGVTDAPFGGGSTGSFFEALYPWREHI